MLIDQKLQGALLNFLGNACSLLRGDEHLRGGSLKSEDAIHIVLADRKLH